MRVPVFEQGQSCGELYAEQRGLYTIFRAEIATSGICKIHAVFEQGEVALGVPVPEQGQMVLRISVPTSRLPRGRLMRGIVVQKGTEWSRFPGGRWGELTLPEGRRRDGRYQFPWVPGQPQV